MPTKVWLLYRPEPFDFNSDDDRSIHLWVRRCEIFTSREGINEYFEKLNIQIVKEIRHELFFELELLYDRRGFRWLVCYAEIDPHLRM